MTTKASVILLITALLYLAIYRTEDGVVWVVLAAALVALSRPELRRAR